MGYDRTRARQRRQATLTQERSAIWSSSLADIHVTEPRTLSRQVWDDQSALSIPGVAKALSVHQLIGVMPIQRYRGVRPLPQPRLLAQPDFTSPGSTWFVQQHVRDWLIHGNACHLITARGRDSLPSSTRYYPARCWDIELTSDGFVEAYYLNGKEVPREDVVHVQRGQHPLGRGLGWGIVEQHLLTLDRARLEEESERQTLRGGNVPSAVIVTPQKNLTQENADVAADSWNRKLAGPGRQPVILPNGTQVIPLGWSAADQEMTDARKMTLTDLANVTNMDGYWLGAPGSSHTYRSPGPLWLALLRMTLETPIKLMEDAWSQAWVMPGERVYLDRMALTQDDLASEIDLVAKAVDSRLWTYEEGRVRLNMDPNTPRPGSDTPAGNTDTETAREVAEIIQKLYLGVDVVLTAEEARILANRAGAGLGALPEDFGKPPPAAPAPDTDPEAPPTDPEQGTDQ